MRISVFGMGYVGVVTGACFARQGHRVIGVDIDPGKVDLLACGRSPIIEEGVQELVSEMVRSGRLTATPDHEEAVLETEVSLISVGTPSLPNGSLDLRAVKGVAGQIGGGLAGKSRPHTVIVRSTLLPGTTRGVVIPLLEGRSGKRCGEDFHVSYNPEFLREGSSIKDFYSPPYTVIGQASPEAGQAAEELYSAIDAPLHRCPIEVAEAMKYVSNTFHALKVAFANEVGVVLKSLGVDSHPVMDLVCRDTKLNISAAYLRPGFAFGGSCLPKDVRALVYAGKSRDLELPLLGHLMASNQTHVDRALELVLETGARDVALLGLSFKAGTDDLRESPLVVLAEQLIGKGVRLRIYDPDVVLARLTGANRAYIQRELPHIGDLLAGDLDRVLAGVQVAIVGSSRRCDPEKLEAWARSGTLIDLDRVPERVARAARRYEGICW